MPALGTELWCSLIEASIRSLAVNVSPDRAKVTGWKATLDVGGGLIVRLGRKIVRVKGG